MADQYTIVRFRRHALNRHDRRTHAITGMGTTPGGSYEGTALCGAKPAPATGGWIINATGTHVNCVGCTTALIKATVKHD